MPTTRLGFTLGALLAATVPLGCSAPAVTQPDRISMGNPLPIVSLSQATGATITIRLANVLASFRPQAEMAINVADVDWFDIMLVPDQGSSPTDYNAPPPVGSYVYKMPGPGAATLSNAPFPSLDDANDRMQFTNVPPGTYRARVAAMRDLDDDFLTSGDHQRLNKNDPLNSNGLPTGNDWALSANTATVNIGVPNASYSTGSELSVTVNLRDETYDPVDVQLTVNSGGSGPPIGGVDL